MALALMVEVRARREEEHWEEVYWISLEALFEAYAYITQQASRYEERSGYSIWTATGFPVLARSVSCSKDTVHVAVSPWLTVKPPHKVAKSGLRPPKPEQFLSSSLR